MIRLGLIAMVNPEILYMVVHFRASLTLIGAMHTLLWASSLKLEVGRAKYKQLEKTVLTYPSVSVRCA